MFSLLHLSWGAWLLLTLVLVQTTIFCVTIYLHRCQAHRALDVHPALEHVMRFWLWLATGMSTPQWVAVHRKHHAHCETPLDPHSPQVHGLKKVLFAGVWLYHREARNPDNVARYAKGVKFDWMERKVYTPHGVWGPVLLTLLDVLLLGPTQGLLLAAIQVAWIPFWAAGVINGVAHAKGYRNFNSADASRNLLPWGLWIGGEELHNNHHAHPTSAKLSYRSWEVDIGWGAIRVLQALGLATVRKAQRRPKLTALPEPDLSRLLDSIAQHRLQVSSWYQRVWNDAVARVAQSRRERKALSRAFIDGTTASAGSGHVGLAKLHQNWQELQALWSDRTCTRQQLSERLSAWLAQAEASVGSGLPELAWKLRRIA